MVKNRYLVKQIHRAQDDLLKRFIFDKVYARKMADHPAHACLGQWIKKEAGDKVLELGCGAGKYVAMLSNLDFQVTGVDAADASIHFPSWEVIRNNTSAQLLDKVFAEHLPFADHTFDHVVCLGALLYFDDPAKGLQEMSRVVKPGGKVVIRTVNKNNFYTMNTGRKLDPASKNLYTMAELGQLVENNGLIVKRKFSYGFWPHIWTDAWWYLVSVWLPFSVQHYLSSMIKPEHHVNNTIFALSPAD